ncbi:glutathione S-transferase family protein [Kordiimonas sp. SCSIO 12610]|uniref:glutathione S-transferase family protein n=1 Tax=Kordiimonas sp. SCSIO 12610 TaxID=2829597 RepID=UPI00210E03BB|nr:glutathione S-transferase family protein [Kordiimonas sp. SCSIO 12610]UTW53929.1 glutathione S-transferase family protein [Kordiimonas sp. SCSIO 12610]
MKIYGDKRSGNCLKVQYVCDYLGISYDWEDVDVLSGRTRSGTFLKLNPSGQVPVIELSDGRCLSQSNAIIRFLANESPLVPANSWARAKMDEWLFWEQYSHEPAIAVCRFHMLFLEKAKNERDPALVTKGESALNIMENHLQDNEWFIGDHITLADIALYAYTQFSADGGFDLMAKPRIKLWLRRVRKELNSSFAA